MVTCFLSIFKCHSSKYGFYHSIMAESSEVYVMSQQEYVTNLNCQIILREDFSPDSPVASGKKVGFINMV